MPISFATTLRSARSQKVIDALDADTNPGYIELYTATQPVTAGAAVTTQVKLGTVTLSKPCGAVSNGVITFSVISDDINADNDGDIDWGRAFDGAGTFVADMNAGLLASSAVLKFNNLTARVGGIIKILSGSITEGNV